MTNNASKHTGVCQSTNQNPSNQPLPVPDTVFSSQEIRHELSKTGLNGLVFDHSSFPCITLQQKSFIMSDDANFNPTSFEVMVLQTTEKHILVDSKDVNFTEALRIYSKAKDKNRFDVPYHNGQLVELVA